MQNKNGKHTPVKVFIERAKKAHGDKYDYSKVSYNKLADKVTIICPIHGDFHQIGANHIKGQGCPTCGLIKRTTGRRLPFKDFLNKANKIHCNRYTYIEDTYEKASGKVTIVCPTHGKFNQLADAHMKGQECPRCSVEKGLKREKDTTESFISKAKKVHQNKFDYSKVVYKDTNTKVPIMCNECGNTFYQVPNSHLQGHGCWHCHPAGFRSDQPAILYYLSIDSGTAYKIGITNSSVEKRFTLEELQRVKVIATWQYESGIECYRKEQQILKDYKMYKYTGPSLLKVGNTELFNTDILNLDSAK
jgi:protein-arginine kinase activator protein McsA